MTKHRWAVLAVVALVFALGGAVGFVLRDAYAIQDDVEQARNRLERARDHARDQDVPAASRELDAADRALASARRKADGAIWQFASQVPWLGTNARTVSAGIDLADAAVELLSPLVDVGATILHEGVVTDDRRIDLEPLRRAADVAASLPVERLESARESLAAVPSARLLSSVQQQRTEALQDADALLADVDRLRSVLTVLPPLLGGDGPRRYLLAMQNSAELRGTGGLIGLFAIVTFDRGKIALSSADVFEAADAVVDESLEPVSAPPEFVDRYGHLNAAGYLKNVNVDPHLPMTGDVLLRLYQDRTGTPLDGIIALDPMGLATILDGIGSFRMPDEAPDSGGRIPDRIRADALPTIVMVDAYEVFGGPSDEREAFLQHLAEAAFDRIIGMDWELTNVARKARQAFASRHLQLYSAEPGEQAVFERFGVAGELGARSSGDLLSVTANNAGANKQDVHVGHALEGRIDLAVDSGSVGSRRTVLRLTVDNPLPRSGMDAWIIGSSPAGGSSEGGLTGERGLNRTWFTIWSPEGAELLAARDGDGAPIRVGSNTIHGHVAIDHHLETPSESRRSVEFEISSPTTFQRRGDDLIYRLTLWRQAKAIPDDLDLSIHVPRGWQLRAADVDGGGTPWRLDVSADALQGPRELEVEVHPGHIRLRGEVSEDVVVELVMRPG